MESEDFDLKPLPQSQFPLYQQKERKRPRVKKVDIKDRQSYIKIHHEIIREGLNHVSTSQMYAFKKYITDMLPNESLPTIVQNLYDYLLKKYQFDPNQPLPEKEIITASDKSERFSTYSQHSAAVSIDSSQTNSHFSSIEVLSYLNYESMPPIAQKSWPSYHPQSAPFFDIVFDEEKSPEQALRYEERRFVMYSFIQRGYGLIYYMKDLKSNSQTGAKRYKSVIYSAMNSSIRSVQEFLIKAKGDSVITLRKLGYRLPSILCSLKKYFSQQQSQTFLRCLRTNYQFETEPASLDDILDFYQQFGKIVQMHNAKATAIEANKIQKKKRKLQQVEESESDSEILERIVKKCRRSKNQAKVEVKEESTTKQEGNSEYLSQELDIGELDVNFD